MPLPAQLERTLEQFGRSLPKSDLGYLVAQAIALRADVSAQALTPLQQLFSVAAIAPAGGYSKRAALDAFVTRAAGTIAATPVVAGADFTGADLGPLALDATSLTAPLAATGTRWTGATFDGTDLTGATLTGAFLDGTRVGPGGVILAGANLTDAVLTKGLRRPSQTTRVVAGDDVALGAVNLEAANLTRADLSGADLSGVVFSSSAAAGNLTGARLVAANLQGARLSSSTGTRPVVLTNATVLDHADLRGADLSAVTTLTGVSMFGAVVDVRTLWLAAFDPIAAKVNPSTIP